MGNDRIHRIILGATSAVLIVFEFFALGVDSHFKYDFICLMILLFAVFWLRTKIFLHWAHFLLFCIFLIIHDLGVFRAYEWYPLGLEYDYWVHGFFGFVSSMIILRALRHSKFRFDALTRVFLTVMIVLGLSAAHELYEFGGAVLLGEGEGVLFIGAGDLDEWDTQKDMLNNVIGCFFALIAYGGVTRRLHKPGDDWEL